MGDRGLITTETGAFRVEDTQRMGDGILHIGVVESGILSVGQLATQQMDEARKITMRHHTTTHMLNWALRKVLGPNIDQKVLWLTRRKPVLISPTTRRSPQSKSAKWSYL